MAPSPSFENVDLDAEGTQKEPAHDPQRPAPARCRPSQQRAPGRGHHQAARIHPVVDVRPPRALAAVPGPVVCESAGLHPLDAPLPRVPDGRGRRLRDHPPPRGRLRDRGHPRTPVVPGAPGRHHRSLRRRIRNRRRIRKPQQPQRQSLREWSLRWTAQERTNRNRRRHNHSRRSRRVRDLRRHRDRQPAAVRLRPQASARSQPVRNRRSRASRKRSARQQPQDR